MNKYLFTTLPSNDLGLLTRSLPIAHELRNRGHQVAFCSPAKAPSKLISDAGFDNLLPGQPLYQIVAGNLSSKSLFRFLCSRHFGRDIRILLSFLRRALQASTAEIWDIDHFMYLLGMWNEAFIQSDVETFLEVFAAYQPDVIVDFWNPFACIAARASNKPLISVIQADMHPESMGFIWWKEAPSQCYPSPIPATNTILAKYRLPQIQKMGELLIGDLTLVVGIPETDPLPTTADVTYIGPILWQRQEEGLPDWIYHLGREQPVIWLYPGNLQYMRGVSTFGDSAVVLQACIEALKNEPVQVVLTTGYHSLLRRFLPLPRNFYHEPYVPGLAMAERSDLLIHHGGYGSCQTGLYTGRPALIIPTYSERESNARRIAAVGAGDYVLPASDSKGRNKQVSSEEVRTKVFNILSDESFARNAKRISECMKSYGGAPEAARLIEKFIQVTGKEPTSR
jgi:UDP:flavonoid glycosyltransferase YjiC (YdhE family)